VPLNFAGRGDKSADWESASRTLDASLSLSLFLLLSSESGFLEDLANLALEAAITPESNKLRSYTCRLNFSLSAFVGIKRANPFRSLRPP